MLIGLIGKKRSGKDTIADFLANKYNFKKFAFADAIKDLLKLLFNFSDDQLNTNLKEENDINFDITPRKAMQWFGTDIMQFKINELLPNIGRLFWVNRLKNIIKNNNTINNDNIVITDFRFKHEINSFNREEIIFIHIIRDNNNLDIDGHISENELNTIDNDMKYNKNYYVIYNNSTLQNLYNDIDLILFNININIKN